MHAYMHKYVHVCAGAWGFFCLQLLWGLNLGPYACPLTESSLLPKAAVIVILLLLLLLLLSTGFHFVAQVCFELMFSCLNLLSTRFREVHLAHLEAVIHMWNLTHDALLKLPCSCKGRCHMTHTVWLLWSGCFLPDPDATLSALTVIHRWGLGPSSFTPCPTPMLRSNWRLPEVTHFQPRLVPACPLGPPVAVLMGLHGLRSWSRW